MNCAICYKACNFTKINTPPCVFVTFFKLCKWYKIAQCLIFNLSWNFVDQLLHYYTGPIFYYKYSKLVCWRFQIYILNVNNILTKLLPSFIVGIWISFLIHQKNPIHYTLTNQQTTLIL